MQRVSRFLFFFFSSFFFFSLHRRIGSLGRKENESASWREIFPLRRLVSIGTLVRSFRSFFFTLRSPLPRAPPLARTLIELDERTVYGFQEVLHTQIARKRFRFELFSIGEIFFELRDNRANFRRDSSSVSTAKPCFLDELLLYERINSGRDNPWTPVM